MPCRPVRLGARETRFRSPASYRDVTILRVHVFDFDVRRSGLELRFEFFDLGIQLFVAHPERKVTEADCPLQSRLSSRSGQRDIRGQKQRVFHKFLQSL